MWPAAVSPDGRRLYVFTTTAYNSAHGSGTLYSVKLSVSGNLVHVTSMSELPVPPGVDYISLAVGSNGQLFALGDVGTRSSYDSTSRVEIFDINPATMEVVRSLTISADDAGSVVQRISVLGGTESTLLAQVSLRQSGAKTSVNTSALFVVNMATGLIDRVEWPQEMANESSATVQSFSASVNGRFLSALWRVDLAQGGYLYRVAQYNLPELTSRWSVPFSCPASPLTGVSHPAPSTIVTASKG